MNELATEEMESSNEPIEQEAFGCPLQTRHTQRTVLDADDEIVFPKHKRVVTEYSTDASGVTELHVYYGEKEISFDEPGLFAFGEGLAKQSRFVAGTATTWGEGYDWPRVRELLEQLIREGILRRTEEDPSETSSTSRACPSPLPAAETTVPCTWFECEAITRELTGHPLELGYLELVVPVYRVAHMALDAEGRQLGEANVFPGPLRLDVPTEWRTCPYPGSRYQDDEPMNVTALKSLRKHWAQTMVALLRTRDAYLRRFPQARHGWTVGDLHRLASLVLTVPAYLLMRKQQRVENGHLHPVLSSMFRVTDGVHVTTTVMLYMSTEEQAPDASMTSAEIYAYAERNCVFHSTHGVCAAPRTVMEEFFSVFVDGKPMDGDESVVLDAPVQSALDDLDAAFDYCLYGLQAQAVMFSLWPAMGQAYEHLLAILKGWSGERSEILSGFQECLQSSVQYLQTSNGLKAREWSVRRELVNADMYAQCANGLGPESSGATLSERLAPIRAAHHAHAAEQLRTVLRRRFYPAAAAESPVLDSLVAVLMDYFRQEQAVVRTASEIQRRINRLLGRTQARRPLKASDLLIYYQMQEEEATRRQPYLVDDLEEMLGLHVVVTTDTIEISERAVR
jgi:hypothetical protein